LIDHGTSSAPRKGWFLEKWPEATTVRLSILETNLKAKDELPSSARISVAEAEKALWRALSDGKLVAEALNDERRPVDIPQREWSYLNLFEEGKRDALKYNARDRQELKTTNLISSRFFNHQPIPVSPKRWRTGSPIIWTAKRMRTCDAPLWCECCKTLDPLSKVTRADSETTCYDRVSLQDGHTARRSIRPSSQWADRLSMPVRANV
jgi:hypothetical protein